MKMKETVWMKNALAHRVEAWATDGPLPRAAGPARTPVSYAGWPSIPQGKEESVRWLQAGTLSGTEALP